MIAWYLLTAALALDPTVGVDCIELVDRYNNERFEHPTDGMPDVFLGALVAAGGKFTVVNGTTQSSTELACDERGKVLRLLFTFAWTGERDADKTILTEIGMIVLAAPFAPGTGLITDLFERADASALVEQLDLPGPYLVTVEVSPSNQTGGVMTLVVEMNMESTIAP